MAIDPIIKELICEGYALAKKALTLGESVLINEDDLPVGFSAETALGKLQGWGEKIDEMIDSVEE
jgi:hypothetical protein